MRSLPSQSNAFLPTPSARRATFGPFLITVRRPFLPTPSARRATQSQHNDTDRVIAISTHALREEGDKSGLTCEKSIVIFLPTPSARRATQKTGRRLVEGKISTHALREEGDVRCTGRFPQHFISTHALREEGDRQSTKTG